MQKQYTAISGFPYKTRHLLAGETFEADEKMGTLLVKMGRAKHAPATPASAPQVPAAPAHVAAPVAAQPVLDPEALAFAAEPPPQAEPEQTAKSAEAPPAEEPAKPAFKTRRSYGSRSL